MFPTLLLETYNVNITLGKMSHTEKMTGTKRQLQPGADEALQEVVDETAELRAIDELRAATIQRRAAAIGRALSLGHTLSSIGDGLGVSNQRVDQMRKV
jgi:hypothetical protein